MRVVPGRRGEEDNSQKFWIFGPSFIESYATSSSGEDPEPESESEDLPPPLLPPPPAPPQPSRAKKRPREAGKGIKKEPAEIKEEPTEIQDPPKRKRRQKKKPREKIAPEAGGSSGRKAPNGRVSSTGERWTMERYERAELKVIEVMREKAAEHGNQIPRKDLREGARKHIGDTGLLDHLLKHMAGKVVGDRGERFMRGYSSDGVMQYWLEPADLQDNRRLGALGDGCRCGSECKVEIGQLKEKIGILQRDMEELQSLKELEKNVWKENYERLLKRNIKLETDMEGMNSSFQGLKENYERLLKRNMKLESQMAGMSSSFEGLKEDMLLLREEKKSEEEDERKTSGIETVEDPKDNSDNGVGDTENNSKPLQGTPSKSFCSPQLQRGCLQIPCRGRAYVNSLNGSQKSLVHLTPLESDQHPSMTNPECTAQRH